MGSGSTTPTSRGSPGFAAPRGYRVQRAKELDHALEQAFQEDGGPALIDVVTSPAPLPMPEPPEWANVPALNRQGRD